MEDVLMMTQSVDDISVLSLRKFRTPRVHEPLKEIHKKAYGVHYCENNRDLQGLHVIITGGASGIGKATAIQMARRGASIMILDYADETRNILDKISCKNPSCKNMYSKHLAVQGDLRSSEVVNATIDKCLETWKKIDAVIFAAGSSEVGKLYEKNDDEIIQMIDKNLLVHTGVTRKLIETAKTGRLGDNKCSLVYVVSKHGVAPSSGFGAYPIAKSAELQLMRIVAIEGAKYGIRSNAVSPGAVFEGSNFWTEDLVKIKSSQHEVSTEDLEKYYANRTILKIRVTPQDVSQAVIFLATDQSQATTGAIIPVDGGLEVTFTR